MSRPSAATDWASPATRRSKAPGAIAGDLRIGPFGIHQVGSSPGVQCVQGNYTMDGALQIELRGSTPGDGIAGYDQVLVAGSRASNVSLSGSLVLDWGGTGWSAPGDELWIIRNDTAGTLQGTFHGLVNGAPVGSYDGAPWFLYYGADAASGQLTGGNDVVLIAAAQVPEPSASILAILAVAAAIGARRWGGRHRRGGSY